MQHKIYVSSGARRSQPFVYSAPSISPARVWRLKFHLNLRSTTTWCKCLLLRIFLRVSVMFNILVSLTGSLNHILTAEIPCTRISSGRTMKSERIRVNCSLTFWVGHMETFICSILICFWPALAIFRWHVIWPHLNVILFAFIQHDKLNWVISNHEYAAARRDNAEMLESCWLFTLVPEETRCERVQEDC